MAGRQTSRTDSNTFSEVGRSTPSRQGLVVQLVLILGTAALILLITQDFLLGLSPLQRLELSTIDYRFALRGPLPVPKESLKVVILEISQESMKSLPDRWPWPRSYFARVVRNLKRAGALAVGIDLVFDQRDPHSPKNDEELRKAIRETRIVVLAGKTEIGTERYGEIRREDQNYSNIFFDVDSSIGTVYLRNDEDGVYRRYRPLAFDPVSQRRIPSFSFAVLNKVFGKPALYTAEVASSEFTYIDRKIPKYDAVSMLINYYGSDRTFPHIKFADVMDDAEFSTVEEQELGEPLNTFDDPDFGYLHSGTFQGKVVLIGSTMPEDKDLFPVSLAKGEQAGDNLMYGVEIHGNVIQNVFDKNFLTREPQWLEALSVVMLCFGMFFATTKIKEVKFGVQVIGDLMGGILVLFVLGAILGISVILFSDYGYVAAVTSPSLGVLGGFVSATVYNYITERRQKVLIKGMFSQYVSPTVVEELVAHPEKLRLGGERRELTVLFSDIVAFATISESLNPERLVGLLNEYLAIMTDIIFATGGTLDKYEGDAIMAFWGAPIPQEDHALRACKAALEMQKSLIRIRGRWEKEGKPDLNVRIGLSTGEMVVGNMGGRRRFDYTVMGDTVNLGSRLEGANKEYRTSIMISQKTFEQVKGRVLARQLDLILVKGRTEPVAAYELLGLAGDQVPQEERELLELYERGIQHYRRREWDAAIAAFKKVLSMDPHDYPSRMYIDRVMAYKETPPPPEWNGVFVLKTK